MIVQFSIVSNYKPERGGEGFSSTHLKEVTRAKSILSRLKIKSQALKSTLTRILINASSKLEAKRRKTPLHFAALKGSKEIVERWM